MAHDRVLERDAVGAQQRASPACNVGGHPHVVELAVADVLRTHPARVLELADPRREQQAVVDRDMHLDEFLLDDLARRDRAPN